MQVILLERIPRLGQMGDIVEVKNGYARNFLIPQNKALRATNTNKAIFESQKAQLEARNIERKAEAEKIAQRLNDKIFVVIRSAGETGHLYGSVSTRDIADLIEKENVTISRNQIELNHPLKTIGLHKLRLHLFGEIYANIVINIARSQEEAQRQEKGENVLERKEDLEFQEPAAVEAEAEAKNSSEEA